MWCWVVFFCSSFATDIATAADDDYNLFADTSKCRDRLAVEMPTTELEPELNSDNKMVNAFVKFASF